MHLLEVCFECRVTHFFFFVKKHRRHGKFLFEWQQVIDNFVSSAEIELLPFHRNASAGVETSEHTLLIQVILTWSQKSVPKDFHAVYA